MTAQEILEAHFGSDFWALSKDHTPHIYNAMSEYAKQEAIKFEKFSRGNFQPFMASGLFVEKVKFDSSSMWPDLETVTKYTNEELYNLYMQSKLSNKER